LIAQLLSPQLLRVASREEVAMNLILKFAGPVQREKFFNKLAEERTDIVPLFRGSKSVPQAVVSRLSPEQAQWVRQHLGGLGSAYDDVQFETLSGLKSL
jgi:hypothetical protein